jgi:protein-S-isoprenylcysteine O-methyltransferase Ste14
MNAPREHQPGSRLPALGRRGEGWVACQILLISAILFSATLGHGWSRTYAVVAYVAGGTVLALGLILLAWAGIALGASLTPFPAPKAGQELITTGAYTLVRHPMYGGGILIAVGWSIVFASIVGLGLAAVLAIFLDLKARREETWLREQVAGYAAYCERTRRKLLPFVF